MFSRRVGGKASCNPFGKEAGVQVRRVRAIRVETAWPDLPPVPRAEAGDPVVAHAGSWCGPSTAVALPSLGDCPPGLTTDTWELGPALSADGGAGTRLPCCLAWTPRPGPPSLPPHLDREGPAHPSPVSVPAGRLVDRAGAGSPSLVRRGPAYCYPKGIVLFLILGTSPKGTHL